MLEGLDTIMQRIDTIQSKMQQLSGYGERFSEILRNQTRKQTAGETPREDAGPSPVPQGENRNAEALASQIAALTTRGANAFGGLSGDEDGGMDLMGLASKQAALPLQRLQEAQRMQDITSQAARLRPAAYGNAAFDQHIRQAATNFGIPFALIKAVVHQESEFNPYAVSRAGAQGLMQIMPQTGQSLGLRNPFDAGENIMAGSAYLKEMLERYNGNLPLALAAYNAGPNAVDAAGGVPNFSETKEYVQRVLSYYARYS